MSKVAMKMAGDPFHRDMADWFQGYVLTVMEYAGIKLAHPGANVKRRSI